MVDERLGTRVFGSHLATRRRAARERLGDPDEEAAFRKAADANVPQDITQMRNADGGIPETYLEADPTLNDYYTTTGKYEVLALDRSESKELLEGLSEEDRALLESGKQY